MSDVLAQITGLSQAQLTQIIQLPDQIQSLVRTAQGDLTSVTDGSATDSPLSELLGTLGTLGEAAQQTPGVDQLVAGVGEVFESLPTGSLADVTQVAASVEETLDQLGPLKEVIRSGDFSGNFEDLISQGLDAMTGMSREGGDLDRIGDELRKMFRLFRSLLGWGSSPPDPGDVADLLSEALIGCPINYLDQAAAALADCLIPLEDLLPDGPDRTAWQGAAGELELFWQGVADTAAGEISWPALEAELQSARARLVEIAAARDRLFSASLSSINALELPALPQAAAAIQAIPRVRPQQMTPIFDGLRLQLQGMVDEFTDFAPTPEELQSTARSIIDFYFDNLENSSLGRLRTEIIDFQQTLVGFVESLPFRDIAREVEAALRKVAEAADILDPESVRRPIREFFDGLEGQIEDFSQNAVREEVQAIWGRVETALGEVADAIGQAQTVLQEAVTGLSGYVDSATESLGTITAKVDEIRQALDGFSLAQPADEVVEQLREIEEMIAELDVSSLPDALVSALDAGLDALADFDLTAEVSGPIDELLGRIDPTPLLETAGEGLGSITGELDKLDPARLAESLDDEVDQLLEKLSELGPDLLRRLLEEALEPVKEALRSLDFGELLAPLLRLYAELVAAVDAVLDPQIIFEPLEELFQPVVDAVDALDPARLIELLGPHASGLGSTAESAAQPPSALASEGGVLKDSMATTSVDVDDDLFGYRPGDMLIPLIDLHAKLMEAVEGLDEEVLTPAAQRLRGLRGTLDSLDPAAVLGRVESVLASVEAEFEPAAVSVRLTASADAFGIAAGRIAVAARADLPDGDRAIADRVLAVLGDLDPLQLVPADASIELGAAARLRIEGGTGLAELRAAFAGFGPEFRGLLPGFLDGDELDGAGLVEALRAIDPAPIRVEINDLFDQLGARVVALQPVFQTVLEETLDHVEEFLLPISPSNIITLAQRLHGALAEQVLALGPATFKDEVTLLFDTVKGQLEVLDPAILVEELNGLRDAFIDALDALLEGLLPDSAIFDELIGRLAALKPSVLLEPLTESLEPLSDMLDILDPATLLEPLIEAIARVRGEVPETLRKIEDGLDAVLRAFPEGGGSGASASGSVSVG